MSRARGVARQCHPERRERLRAGRQGNGDPCQGPAVVEDPSDVRMRTRTRRGVGNGMVAAGPSARQDAGACNMVDAEGSDGHERAHTCPSGTWTTEKRKKRKAGPFFGASRGTGKFTKKLKPTQRHRLPGDLLRISRTVCVSGSV